MSIDLDNAREQAQAAADTIRAIAQARIIEMVKSALENDRVLVEKTSDFLADLHLTRSSRIAQLTEEKIQKAQVADRDSPSNSHQKPGLARFLLVLSLYSLMTSIAVGILVKGLSPHFARLNGNPSVQFDSLK